MEATISVNGETRGTKPGATVIDLLHELGLDGGHVAIESGNPAAPEVDRNPGPTR
jgi:sulfur carrier protein ThiS